MDSLSVPKIVSKSFVGMTPNSAGTLLMTWRCAFSAYDAVWMHMVCDINKNHTILSSNSVLFFCPSEPKNRHATLHLLPTLWAKMSCICNRVNKKFLMSFCLCLISFIAPERKHEQHRCTFSGAAQSFFTFFLLIPPIMTYMMLYSLH